jgi:hypothetical protein
MLKAEKAASSRGESTRVAYFLEEGQLIFTETGCFEQR